MKVILSRKGFDSSNGGIVSPIFEDGTMISFPIPSPDKDTFDDLIYGKEQYTKILNDLNYKGKKNCHVDPDLNQSRRKKQIEGWFPAFGQIDSSASYLKNCGIGEGDIFLFFGNFHFVEKNEGKYRYIRKTGDFYKDNDIQVIWGYLQVGEIIDDVSKQKDVWWHPHSCDVRISNKTNVIFKAKDRLSFDNNKLGAGLLDFDKKRVLTLEGFSKGIWKNNKVYDLEHIYGNRKNSAKDSAKGIYYAGIWQELVLVESDECSEWAKSIIVET
ncbi:hypothetical protein ACTNBM_11765 [Lachnospiraceae bacterium HCP1S3_C3]